MRAIYLLIVIVVYSLPLSGQNKFSKEVVLEDVDYLKTSLEEAHYNLYAYVTKKAFNDNVEKIKSSITKDSLSLLETTSLLQAVISKANNGHTEINFPISSYFNFADNGGTLFPLDLAFENGKALIRQNLTNNPSLEIGAEVISINNQSINDLLHKIFPLISAERQYFKLAKLELFSFSRYYWQAWGEQKTFNVKIKTGGKTKTYQLEPITVADFNNTRNELNFAKRKLSYLDHSAYLMPGNFGGDMEKFRHFIDSSFVEINKRKLPNLIIDLRNNLGGDESFSNYLVSYIADHPFLWNAEFTLKTSAILKEHVKKTYDISKPYWKKVMENKDGSIYPYEFEPYQPQPEEKRFRGNVYILINRQSHSQSAVTASQIQDYKFATIVGEETGDFPSLYASQYSYNLPNTGVEVKLSKGYIVRVNGSKKAEGVIPDLYIKDHLLDANDEVLDGLLKLINQ
ncbi:MAG: S41 family peptidase [Bacteroidota bacterium]